MGLSTRTTYPKCHFRHLFRFPDCSKMRYFLLLTKIVMLLGRIPKPRVDGSSPSEGIFHKHFFSRATSMRFGYTIIYVSDVAATLDFYSRAFGIPVRFLHESGGYGELETGSTALAFAAHEVASANLPEGYNPIKPTGKPVGIEIGLITDDVPASVEKAVAAGATLISEPKQKPWGQTVAYVRAPEGTLIEVCTAMGG